MTAPLAELSDVLDSRDLIPPTLYTEPSVELIDYMGSDRSVANAARVSTLADLAAIVATDDARDAGLINYLMEHRHGSPFEHGSVTLFIKTHIAVTREFMRHRIGFSYNEMSGRYTELRQEFFVPGPDRPLVNVGSSSRPRFQPAPDLWDPTIQDMVDAYEYAWAKYQRIMGRGVAKEIARQVLPVGIATQFYVTCNPRSLMAFLSLRTESDEAQYKGKPLYEIQQVANAMEAIFASLWPDTHAAFVKHGRVGP